jgi:hypothetical protein
MLIDALKRAVLIPATVEEQSFEVSVEAFFENS